MSEPKHEAFIVRRANGQWAFEVHRDGHEISGGAGFADQAEAIEGAQEAFGDVAGGLALVLRPKPAGRRPIGDRAMTPAERKARSRALSLGAVHGELELASSDLRDWHRYAKERSQGGDDWGEIAAGLDQVRLAIVRAMLAVPKS